MLLCFSWYIMQDVLTSQGCVICGLMPSWPVADAPLERQLILTDNIAWRYSISLLVWCCAPITGSAISKGRFFDIGPVSCAGKQRSCCCWA